MVEKKKRILLMIIFVSLVSFWVVAGWQIKLEAAEQDQTQNQLGLKKPELNEILPILKKILPPANEFRESKDMHGQDCLTDYLGFYNKKKMGVVCVFKLEGQWGPMVVMMGVNMQGEITHLELSYHTETPGCGSQVDRRPFLDQFEGKTLQEPLEIYKDLLEATDAVKGVDCITRATVSSKAVAKGVKEHLKSIVEHYLSGNEDTWR